MAKKLHITEHAKLRYCERILGFESGALIGAMRKLVGGAQSGRFKLPGHEVLAVVENGCLITFIPAPRSRPEPRKPANAIPKPEHYEFLVGEWSDWRDL